MTFDDHIAWSRSPEPTPEAERIGVYLRKHPPPDFDGIYSHVGWAYIAQAVLDVRLRLAG